METRPHILFLNGPNLNRLGKREPEIYGTKTLADVQRLCDAHCREKGFLPTFLQSNHEGVLIDAIHDAADSGTSAIIINAAGLSFTSMSLMDAMKTFSGLKFEVHLSNIHAREPMYHHSLISTVSDAVIAGFGVYGYILAIEAVARKLAVA